MSSNSAKGYNYYAVNKGRKIGIFDNWEATDKQVTGFSGSCYKGFKSEKAAIDYLKRQGISQPERIYTGQKPNNVFLNMDYHHHNHHYNRNF